jgi:hypothetical protein
MKNIIYLAWGSLLWDTKYLRLCGDAWKKTSLKLPLEFTRISDKGRGRLTLVIDEENGTKVNVWERKANTKNLNVAIRRLMKRENTTVSKISYYNAQTDKFRSNKLSLGIMEQIKQWTLEKGYDAVIWTGLQNNWERFRDVPYSLKDAMNYYEGSYEDIQNEIVEYVENSYKIGNIETKFTKRLLNQT